MPLRGPGPLTVFVPTNNAIDRFRDGSVLYMLSDVSTLGGFIPTVFMVCLHFFLTFWRFGND